MEQHEQVAWMLRSFLEGEAVDSSETQSSLHSKEKVAV
jgi:hypothetical protein